MVPKQTIGWMLESIGCFGLTTSQPSKNSFQPFLKHLSIKQSVVSTKQQVVFHLVWKTLSIKKVWECLSFGFNQEWINTNNLPQSYSNTLQQHQAHPAFHQSQRVWILQSMNTLDSTKTCMNRWSDRLSDEIKLLLCGVVWPLLKVSVVVDVPDCAIFSKL